jgi:hypothetical protein
LNDRQWARIEPHLFSGLPGPERDDDRRIISGIIHNNRFNRWAKKDRWQAIFAALAKPGKDAVALSLDSTSIKAHRCASGGKGGSKIRRLAARAAGARPKSMA